MDSFYGGKQGISFVIKDKFTSIAEMNFCFETGYYPNTNNSNNPTEWTKDTSKPYSNRVWYGEYCIINTISTNNIENGKIFKRTAYHAQDSGGSHYAEYIGQIVGPAGGIPKVELDSIEQLKNNFMATTNAEGTLYYPTSTPNTYTNITPTSSNDLGIRTVGANSIYKSGKEYYNTQTPTASITPAFKYGFYTFQSNQQTTQDGETVLPLATLGIGFEIPYVDFAEPTVTMVSYGESASIEQTKLNDFYYRYNFSIPGGSPGGYFSNFKTIKVKPFGFDASNVTVTPPNIYNVEDIDYVSGRNPAYKLATNAVPISDFETSMILAANFMYPENGEWVSGGTISGGIKQSHWFYITDAPTIENVTTDLSNGQYVLYAKFEKHEGTITLPADPEQTGYVYIGPVGPPSLGPWSIKLNGRWSSESTAINNVIITSSGPSEEMGEGNLGVLASADVDYTAAPANYQQPQNVVYFYMWDGTAWELLGQNSNQAALINTNLSNLSILNNTVEAILYAEPNFTTATNTVSFGVMPWK